MPPAVLSNHDVELGALEHFHHFISLGHGSQGGSTIPEEHFYLRITWHRVDKFFELLFDRLTTESLSHPFNLIFQDRIRKKNSIETLLNGINRLFLGCACETHHTIEVCITREKHLSIYRSPIGI